MLIGKYANPELSAIYKRKDIHQGNHAPTASDWWANDPTLLRQGPSTRRPKGNGICKGTASAWCIAFLNQVPEATESQGYEGYYENYLRFQATMIKDFEGDIDSHLRAFNNLGIDTKVNVVKQIQIVDLHVNMIPTTGRWAAYISLCKHDIAIGGDNSTGRYYINEPNTGLLTYLTLINFLNDLNSYMRSFRIQRRVQIYTKVKFWIVKKK
ncbi:hypothetical protein HQQ94_07040 [Shewanella sp. VB17]|uniref:hypothetical protein n=1 Tax=Shewanella sp. VB17 TaxID=2739432 RepID=UPI00156517A5|nr:hypothetical protein [Shewanella sp. VB17]NRD72997.1 hypothetical protein [Shewanella sp. VB17]